MLIPVRCYSCGRVIGHKYQKYLDLIESGKTPDEAFKLLNMPPKNYCCRTIFLTHVNIIDDFLEYQDIEESQETMLVE